MAQPNVLAHTNPRIQSAGILGDPARTNDITVIVGKKFSGKSTQARAILATRKRRLIIDPMWEHSQGAIVRDFESLVSYLRHVRQLREYGVVLRSLNDEDRERAIALCTANTPEDPPLPGLTVLYDEIDRGCSPNKITEPLDRLVNYGRHFQVSLIALARRPASFHRSITANADRIIVGTVQEPRDLDYLTEFIGERLVQRARELRDHEFVTWPDDLEQLEADPAAAVVGASPRGARAGADRRRAAQGRSGVAR